PRSAPATRWRRNTAASCTRYCINPLLPDGALIWPTCRPQAG
ncbi:co-chaperone YbbN, partial [Salmonella enterica subsp. enterica serovar Bovismorbificans]|nr:co-chaperone YbbN [Salmonella enterica subsp. enterica serovar Bovismorbificans]